MKIFKVTPNQHAKELTIIEEKTRDDALVKAKELYGDNVSVEETVFYFIRDEDM